MKAKLSILCLLVLTTMLGFARQHQFNKALIDVNSMTFFEMDQSVTYAVEDIQKMTYVGNTLYVYLKDNTIYSADVSSLSISNNGDKILQNEVVECINALNVAIFPNPTIDILHIEYTLPGYDDIQINLYNLLGQIEKVLYREKQSVGKKAITLNVENIPNGTHVLQIHGNNFSITKTLIKQ